MVSGVVSAKQRRSEVTHVTAAKKSSVLRVAPSREGELIHSLRNTLAALQLRFSLLSSDPTCRWAQEPNLTAMKDLFAAAMATSRQIAELPSAAPGRRRQTRRAVKPAGPSRRG